MLLNFSEVFQQIWEGFIIKDQGRSQEFFQGGALNLFLSRWGAQHPFEPEGGEGVSPNS